MTYISEAMRRQVIERANGACEYCLVHQSDALLTHEVDHIIPIKHRGANHLDNLCLACFECNRRKGSDFASFDPFTKKLYSCTTPVNKRGTSISAWMQLPSSH